MKKKVAKATECKCVEAVNATLCERGLRVAQHLQLGVTSGKAGMSPPCITIERVTKKAAMVTLFCSYCPFCGKRYHYQ